MGFCALSSPFRHCRRYALLPACRSRFHLPASLPSARFCFPLLRGFPRIGTMKALTPAPLTYRAGLPAYFATPSCRSVSNHVGLPGHRLPPRQRDQRVSDFAMNEQARRSSPPNRVRHPTDRPFASGCSPPRLAATQLPSATEFVAYSDTDFHRADVAPSRAHQSNLGRRESQNTLQVKRQEKERRSMRKRHKEMTQNSGREKAHLKERQIEQRRRIFALEVHQ